MAAADHAAQPRKVRKHGAGKVVIGWRENVYLPELGIGPLPAKTDTGARTSALHAENVAIYVNRGGRRVRFDAFTDERRHVTRSCDLPLLDVKRVKSSMGSVESRCVVETLIAVGPHQWRTEISLTHRADMGLPMLLGRATIRGRFLVDPGRTNQVSGGREKRRKRKPRPRGEAE